MIITQTIIRPNGTVETAEIEVDDNYFTAPPPPEPTEQEDNDAMLVNHEYRLTLIELGL